MSLSPALLGYSVLTTLAAPFAPLLLRRRLAAGKEDPERVREKLGEPSRQRPAGRLVWVHAVSVGESLAAVALVGRLIAARPGLSVLVTTTTVTSARLMEARLPEGAFHQYLPLDLPGPVARFLGHWRPDAAVFVESEFWPRLLGGLERRGIPALLVNARISDASARQWGRVPGASRALLRRFAAIQVPDDATAKRFRALGADPARVDVTGSLKETLAPLPFDAGEAARLKALLMGRPVWLAASTHPGEEEVVAEAHKKVRAARADALLILAPRHPDRGPAIAGMLGAQGWSVARRGAGEVPAAGTDIYLADTLGEMGLWYGLAPVSFVGGSLVPVGGHNPYEPVAQGSAVISGSETGNFRDIYDRLREAGGATLAATPDAIAAGVLRLFAPDESAAQVARATGAIAGGDSAVAAAVDGVLALIP